MPIIMYPKPQTLKPKTYTLNPKPYLVNLTSDYTIRCLVALAQGSTDAVMWKMNQDGTTLWAVRGVGGGVRRKLLFVC